MALEPNWRAEEMQRARRQEERRVRIGGFIAAVLVVIYIAANVGNSGSGSDSECSTAYNDGTYLLRDDPGALSESEYCERYNDTSYLDDLDAEDIYG